MYLRAKFVLYVQWCSGVGEKSPCRKQWPAVHKISAHTIHAGCYDRMYLHREAGSVSESVFLCLKDDV